MSSLRANGPRPWHWHWQIRQINSPRGENPRNSSRPTYTNARRMIWRFLSLVLVMVAVEARSLSRRLSLDVEIVTHMTVPKPVILWL